MNSRTTAFAALLAAATAGLAAQAEVSAPLLYRTESYGRSTDTKSPLRLAEFLASGPAQRLAPAFEMSTEALDAMARWNREGRLPARNGFTRPLSSPLDLRVTAEEANRALGTQLGGGWLAKSKDRIVWGTSIVVEGSNRLRVEFRNLEVPPGAEFWVWGEGESPIAFDPNLAGESGSLWSPSVSGPVINIEVSWPQTRAADLPVVLRISSILEIFNLDNSGSALEGPLTSDSDLVVSCVVSAACVPDSYLPGISQLKKGVARLEFVDGGNGALCSGTLLNNTLQDGTPYLLTANHCFDSQAGASTVEAFWDYIASGCPGSIPSLASVPRSIGSTLLATSTVSDFSLIRLSTLPSGRTFLGWSSSAASTANGTVFPRLHHPLGAAMAYSETTAWTPPTTCPGLSTSNFVYSDPAPELGKGADFGGSSGSALLLGNGQVVGQLGGGCGPNADEPCLAGPNDSDYDGRLSVTFPSIAQYLNPSTGSGPCVQNATTLCLLGDRFEVKATYTDYSNNTGPGQAVELTPDSGYFWFFDASNVEAVGKVVSFCPVNGSFGFYAGGLTDVGVVMTVRDTVANQTQTFTNNRGHNFDMISSAFNTCAQ